MTMQRYLDLRRLHKPLADAGLVPDNCRLLQIDIGVTGAFQVTYQVMFTTEQVATLGRVFQDVATAVTETA
jgi:hypothetical protein